MRRAHESYDRRDSLAEERNTAGENDESDANRLEEKLDISPLIQQSSKFVHESIDL